MRPPDDELARRIRSGDHGAFDALFDGYAGPLLGYLTGMVGHRAVAEDLLQDTMLRVFRNIGRYEERGTFRAWVFRIATNLALSELRRRRFEVTEPLDERVLEMPDLARPDPIEHLEIEERSRIVTAALARIGDEHRAVFLLRARHGMELKDIASILCVPEGTVKSRIHHAVRKLKEIVEQSESSGEERRREDMR